ncbi:MAG: ketoacyl-ACP synthase III [Halanaerobiales bacterium]|nr:ketoacyl-ACP synthase III [Halanaerobiales bacterium]
MDVNMSLREKYFAGIKGVGYYVPKKVVTNHDLAKKLDISDDWIRTNFGIEERRIADETETLSDLAYEAGKRALEDAKVQPEEINLIILSRVDPDQINPATACLLQDRLATKNAAACDIVIGGCAGGVYSLAIGANFVVSGSCKNVLVITGDVLSRNIINQKDKMTSCQFGDGVAAAVISRVKANKGIKTYLLKSDGERYDTCIIPAGGSRVPLTAENIDSNERYLHMDQQTFENFATNVLPDSIKKVTELASCDLQELDFVLFSQASEKIIENSMKKLGLPMEKTHTTFEKYGNTGGASTLITLCEAIKEGQINPGDKIALSSFGAGLAWASMYLEWCTKGDFI